MDQQKIGNFLKELRKEKNLTQEQVAEKLNVSGRTVSRWETGFNMPDISLLVEIAEFYDVSIPEILDGERKSDQMKDETKETAIKMAEFSDAEKEKINRNMRWLFLAGIVAAAIYFVLLMLEKDDNFFGGLCLGITFGMPIVGFIMTSKNASRIREFKMRLLKKNKK